MRRRDALLSSPRKSTMSETAEAVVVQRARQAAAAAELVVVKAGTNSLTDDSSHLDPARVDKLVDDVQDLREAGKAVIVVSSGAVGAGIGRMQLPADDLQTQQALSTIGQSRLMRAYTESFDRYETTVAQILISEEDLRVPPRFANLRQTIEQLVAWGVVPIINENDALATAELRIGDNDMIAAGVTVGVEADLLVTLTDVDGVYTAHPREEPSAERVPSVTDQYSEVEQLVAASSEEEFGGMLTKIRGARDVAEAGVPAIITACAAPDVLARVAGAEPVGTIFVPTTPPV
jgi:glutamate 5-kinase (EC 2.7.2.11)